MEDNGFVQRYIQIEQTLAQDIYQIAASGIGLRYNNCLEISQGVVKDEYMQYVTKYNNVDKSKISVLYLGMNPSWKSKNAIPFDYANDGETPTMKVRQWLGIQAANGDIDLPNDPFWSFIKASCETPVNFFENCVVRNYCPIAFGVKGKKGPDQDVSLHNLPGQGIRRNIMKQIKHKCDEAVKAFIELLVEHREEKKLHIIILGNFGIEKRISDIVVELQNHVNIICGPYQFLHPACRNTPDEWKLLTIKRVIESNIFPYIFHGQYHESTTTCLGKLAKSDIKGVSKILEDLQINGVDSDSSNSESNSSS